MRCLLCIKKIKEQPKGSRLCGKCRKKLIKNLGIEE